MAIEPNGCLESDQGSWSASLCLRGLLDRFANAQIGPATTDVAGHRAVDVGIGRTRGAGEQRRRRHDLARLAVATLHDLAVEPRLLDLGAHRCRADRLDGSDIGRSDAVERSNAGTDGGAVLMHSARAAQRHPAAKLRAGQAEHVAQHPQQRCVAVDINAVYGPVDFDGECHDALSDQIDVTSMLPLVAFEYGQILWKM